MSQKELSRTQVVQQASQGRLRYRRAAEQLGVTVRQIKRLVKAYRQGQARALVSKKRGRPSNHQLDPDVKAEALALLHTRYPDFPPTLAHEQLTERHHLVLSDETVRHLMIQEGLWAPKKAKRPMIHQLRTRRSRFGELVQVDGSPFDWFEGRSAPCTLLVYIDDATGRFMELWFVEAESTWSYFEATEHYLLAYGKPLAFYTDKLGVFKVNQPRLREGAGLTQFGRALTELEIELICANTPQAKGRVEKANQTLQGRLPKALRLAGLSTPAEANRWLPNFREDLNRRFAIPAANPEDAHRPLRPQDDLGRILTLQEMRTLSKNLTLQYCNRVYQIQTDRPSYALRQARVLVREERTGTIRIEYRGKPLAYTVLQEQSSQASVVSSKELNPAVTKRAQSRAKRKAHIPPPDHPWRSFVIHAK